MVRELISNLMGFYFSLRDGLKGKDGGVRANREL